MIYLDQVRVDLNPAEETLQANHYRKLKFTSNACRTTPQRLSSGDGRWLILTSRLRPTVLITVTRHVFVATWFTTSRTSIAAPES